MSGLDIASFSDILDYVADYKHYEKTLQIFNVLLFSRKYQNYE